MWLLITCFIQLKRNAMRVCAQMTISDSSEAAIMIDIVNKVASVKSEVCIATV